jgi:hypothetical protein
MYEAVPTGEGGPHKRQHSVNQAREKAAKRFYRPVQQPDLSLGEDALAVSISYVTRKHPMIALTIAVALLVVMVACASMLIRAVRRRFARRRLSEP